MAIGEKLENQEVLISMASGTALRCLYEKLSCKVYWDHTSLGLPLAWSAEVSNVGLQGYHSRSSHFQVQPCSPAEGDQAEATESRGASILSHTPGPGTLRPRG